jgi:hypothetical protein
MTTPERLDETLALEEDGLLYCTVHPTVAKNLRCNRCGRPMCARCAVRTPVGYRCRECVREQQNKFFDAQMLDYIVAAVVSLVMSFVAAAILSRIGFFLIAFFLSPVAGGAIASVVAALTRKRRGRYTAIVVSAGVIVGALPFLLYNLIAIGIYLVMATGAAAARFRLRL